MSQCELLRESPEEQTVTLYIYSNAMHGVARHLLNHGKVSGHELGEYKVVAKKLLKHCNIDIK